MSDRESTGLPFGIARVSPSDSAPSDTSAADSPTVTSDQTHPHPPGRDASFGRWGDLTVFEELGHGAGGRVYRARDEALDREVALKIIRIPWHDPALADTILREGRLLARVRHPNVVIVYWARRIEDEIGLSMELVKGRPLGEIVRREGPMSPDEATLVAISVCRAIAAVHAAGLVHRDVKAGNVMRESGGRIVLMDFGAGRDAAELASLRTAEAAGTPLYMAPEVLGGGRASVMADVYSIGVLMFYLVTGRYPIEGRTVADVAIAHSLEQRLLLIDCRPDLPPDFVRVVERAISPLPRDRYQSVGAMLGDLTAIGQGAPALREMQAARAQPAAASGVAVPRFARYVYRISAAAAAVWFLGFVNWTVFNHTLGRARPFAHESALDWAASGVQSLVPYAAYGALTALVWYVLTSLFRVMSRLSRTWAGGLRRIREKVGALAARVRLNDVEVAAQTLFAVQVLALTTFVWVFRDLLLAVATFISEATPDQVRPLSPENIDTHGVYGLTLTVLILAMVAAWRRVVGWRARTDPARGRGATIAGLVVIAAAVLLLTAPYRLMWHNNQFERADFGSTPCFILGDTPDEFLLYCPGGPVPRTRTVSRADPQLRRLHVFDSIYRWPVAR